MSSFRAIAVKAFAALDTAFGDPLTITPQLSGEFTEPGPDPAKPAFIAIGILDQAAQVIDLTGRQKISAPEITTTTPVAEFAYTQFGPGRPFPQVGWRIDAPFSLLSPPTSGFLIVAPLPDRNDGRCAFELAPLT